LRGLEPKIANAAVARILAGEGAEPVIDWEGFFGEESKKLLEKPVSEIMVPATCFVAPDDPVTKAACLMIQHNQIFLPVIEEKRKLVGLIRMMEVFDELTNVILRS